MRREYQMPRKSRTTTSAMEEARGGGRVPVVRLSVCACAATGLSFDHYATALKISQLPAPNYVQPLVTAHFSPFNILLCRRSRACSKLTSSRVKALHSTSKS